VERNSGVKSFETLLALAWLWDSCYNPEVPRAVSSIQLPLLGNIEEPLLPDYGEEPLFLELPKKVQAGLQALDWSFGEDETGFLAHDIHPYPAKFIPQIPGTLISRLSAKGELVLDPFGGSGTTALEAVRLGRRAVSVDANPLSALIGRAKTASLDRAVARDLQGLHSAVAAELRALPRDPSVLGSKYSAFAPAIPNREKWFADSAFGEMCLLRSRIAGLDTAAGRDIALVALSRIAIRTSFQDSETRYKSVPREVPVGETLRRYLRELRLVVRSVSETEAATRYGISSFVDADARALPASVLPDGSVDLIVTSPPYGNATDYHLYHRFRLLWLGFDPVQLGRVEIGSHLKHQREQTGFTNYFEDLTAAVKSMARVLRPGRYAALVLGDSVYEGERHDPATQLARASKSLGFDAAFIIERPLHDTKRSFVHAGRRATSESMLVMRRQPNGTRAALGPPPYKLWSYERMLRLREAKLDGTGVQNADEPLDVRGTIADTLRFRRLAFTHTYSGDRFHSEPTWQACLENGGASNPAARKDPKYVTHGLHPYKGKFYPQLAKGLLNIADLPAGATILDPFCGSGTTLLEGYLNGFAACGSDMNPLAAKIARAKTAILDTHPDVVIEAVSTVQEAVGSAPSTFTTDYSELHESCVDELGRWFPEPALRKLNWLLRTIRKNSAGAVRDFLEVVLSSIIRDVSQQDPSDLRVRYRKELLTDADVLGQFSQQLAVQYARVEKFWRVRGRAPAAFVPVRVVEGDNRNASTLERLEIGANSVDMVLTSPPYATALPYIDTDRLSLLMLFSLSSSGRRPLEARLIGSREISLKERRRVDDMAVDTRLPKGSRTFLNDLRNRLSKDHEAGFRKQNMPALMSRYLVDMDSAFANVFRVCRKGAPVMIVIGDNRTEVGGKFIPIPTTSLVEELANSVGFESVERIDISVTTENMLHQKNAITKNAVLNLRKP
jgi:DNA modification methylase